MLALATFLVHVHIKMDSGAQDHLKYVEFMPLGLITVSKLQQLNVDRLLLQLLHNWLKYFFINVGCFRHYDLPLQHCLSFKSFIPNQMRISLYLCSSL